MVGTRRRNRVTPASALVAEEIAPEVVPNVVATEQPPPMLATPIAPIAPPAIAIAAAIPATATLLSPYPKIEAPSSPAIAPPLSRATTSTPAPEGGSLDWSNPLMLETFIHHLVDLHNAGKQAQSGFKKAHVAEAIPAIAEHSLRPDLVTVDKLLSKISNLKREWQIWMNFAEEKSGWGVNEHGCPTAGPEVMEIWFNKSELNRKVRKYRYLALPFKDELTQLFGKVVANGSNVRDIHDITNSQSAIFDSIESSPLGRSTPRATPFDWSPTPERTVRPVESLSTSVRKRAATEIIDGGGKRVRASYGSVVSAGVEAVAAQFEAYNNIQRKLPPVAEATIIFTREIKQLIPREKVPLVLKELRDEPTAYQFVYVDKETRLTMVEGWADIQLIDDVE